MERRLSVFQTQKAFWISGSGQRVYCEAFINKMTPSLIELSLVTPNNSTVTFTLHSSDTYKYTGAVHISKKEYEIDLCSFFHDLKVVLYGMWTSGDQSGEFCIHGTVRGLVMKCADNQNTALLSA